MDDALMAMFWAGLAAGFMIGVGVAGLITAVWWFWPERHLDDIGPADEFRVVGDEPLVKPVSGWDVTAATDGWHALENRRRNTDG